MNSKFRFLPLAGVVTLAAAMTACSTVDLYGNPAPVTSSASPAYSTTAQVPVVEYGRVTNVSLVSGTPVAPSSGRNIAGTAIGAIVGGLLGSQVGGGSGRTAATVLGAVGGAVAGNRIAQNTAPAGTTATTNPVYRIEVQTDQGAVRTYDVSATGDLRPGDRVRIENGVIYLA
ncbi:glycine zipper 2TM domain-containing protein [Ramlibacter sp.]|uniref:glycine zipper 2TM domain-containing protein n=1 Tax=Ramlibacter sp. TaxID=1917967 RepID=UPI002C993D39|nr:glycine zipper 2TM domain-containing protein [Ramlibacter sp.]HWI81939.1 glycine zipper 2TM domain-containing protein [Ramlibacter sp.]